jgi:hypothetical protein
VRRQPPEGWCFEADGEKWDLGGSGVNVMRLSMNGHWRDVVGSGPRRRLILCWMRKLESSSGTRSGGDQAAERGTAFDAFVAYA